MNLSTAIVVAYALFCMIGGIVGYVKAKSRASLVSGSAAGLALAAASYGMSQGNSIARLVIVFVAVLLGARFLRTWLKTRRLMPDLLMIILSLATLIAVIWEGS